MSVHEGRAAQPWYVGLIDTGGSILGRVGLRSNHGFSSEVLIEDAVRRAGSEDFGEPAVPEALDRLVASFLEQASASQTGRLALRSHLLDILTERLEMQRLREAVPSIGEEPVTRPIFIFGLPRTGTTLVHNLLAQDPALRVPRTWEVLLPNPRPGARSAQERIHLAERRLRWLDRLAPAYRIAHAVEARLPQECIAITAYALQSIEFHTAHRVPAYQDWLERSDQRPAYRLHRRFLQHLQAEDRRDGRIAGRDTPPRWVLKAPGHLFALEALRCEYPDAVLVQTHRDPLAVAGSISSLGVKLREGFSRHVEPAEVAHDWSARWARALDDVLSMRGADPGLDGAILDLHYDQIVADPIAAVGRIYEHAGLEFTAPVKAAMTAFLAENPQGRHGRHRYTLEEFGLDAARERERFARYADFLGI